MEQASQLPALLHTAPYRPDFPPMPTLLCRHRPPPPSSWQQRQQQAYAGSQATSSGGSGAGSSSSSGSGSRGSRHEHSTCQRGRVVPTWHDECGVSLGDVAMEEPVHLGPANASHAPAANTGSLPTPPLSSSGVTMAEALHRLGPSLELVPMQLSAFVKPHSIMFTLDG